MSSRDNYFSTTELLIRGWTRSLIASLLPEPHLIKRTNYGGTAHLWLKESVIKREELPEFKERLAAFKTRQEKKQQQVKDKYQQAIEKAQTVGVNIKAVDKRTLIKTAVDSYNAYQLDRWCEVGQWNGGEIRMAEMPDDVEHTTEFIDRLCVNFIRHNLTCYDRFIAVYSAGDYREAHKILAKRITDATITAYPWLQREAERQFREKYQEGNVA